MKKKIPPKFCLLFFVFLVLNVLPSTAQTTVFSSDFSTSAGTTYTTANGSIGTNSTWDFIRSGTDFGARINAGNLTLTNDATGAFTIFNGWGMAYATSAIASPYTAILNSNPGLVTWNFNMRQIRSNPSGLSGYGAAFILAGTANTTATVGSGYAIVLGNSSANDPIRLVRYTSGVRNYTTLMTSNTSGLADFGAQYLSIRVTFNPSTSQWQLYVRNDGTSSFQDPASGTLTSQGTVTNNQSTATSLPLIGAFWAGGISATQTAIFDNVSVGLSTPTTTSISPASAVAGSAAFTITVYGTNFLSGSTVRWNGSSRTTTFVSSTQLTAAITAADIATAGTASVTVLTGAAVSNAQTFTINPAGIPSIVTSTNALSSMSTVTGTASTAQTFTVSGANLTANVTATAPANFELSLNGTTYSDSVTLTKGASTTLTGQPVTVYARIKASAPATVYASSITLATTGGTNKTVGVSGTVLSAEPTTSATAASITAIGASAFTVNWTNGNGANHLVVVRQGAAVNASPADGSSYTASAAFGTGSELGTSNYIVYAGTGNSVTVTGLTAATAYYVAVYEFNGSAATQNYRITTPAIANATTLNAPLGLQVATANTAYFINFDSTLDGVNNGAFTGGGISSVPEQGELNSYSWAFSGFSDGAVNFGGTNAEDTVYESGESTGGVTDAGLYGFEVAPDNHALGIQQASGEFAPGTLTFRYQNQTGATITSLSVGYKVYVYNDETGSNSFNLSYSSNNTAYTNAADVNVTTTAAADDVPGWKAYYKVVTITGLSIAANSYGYLRWTGATVSGSAYDELALDDISLVANPSANFATFSGNAETFVVAGNASMSGDVSVAGNIAFLNNSYLAIGANTLTLNGTVTNTTNGGIRGGATSNLVISGTNNPTLSFNQATPNTTNLLNNLTLSTGPVNTVTVNNALAVNSNLNVEVNQTLNLGTATLTGTLTAITNNGTVTTQNTSATPFASGKTWGGTGLVNLNAASTAQTLVAGTYNNLTVTTTAGATATGNVTVNGTLHLPNNNPSATAGSLAMGTNILFMAPAATNTGLGDVSGIVTRNSGIVANTLYTFGNPYTSIVFPTTGTLPSSMSIKTTLGVAPAGKTDAILRTYDFIQTGGTGTKAIITAHYRDSELNGNTENRLVDWVVQPASTPTVLEQGRSNYNTTDNYVDLANVNVAFFPSTFGSKSLTLANSQVATVVWNGSVSDSWTTAANWTPNAVPTDNTAVIIPNATTTPNDPILNPTVTIKSLSIETGGILNSPSGSQFTITGTTGAWINNGTFNPGTGTNNVTFNATTGDATIAGITNFNNITIGTGSIVRPVTDNIMRIAGTITNGGSFNTGTTNNTVEYNGTNQTILTPSGSLTAYDNLIISGTGAIFPTTLNVLGNLTLNQTVNFTGKTISLIGADDQTISGTAAPSFNNLTINKTIGEVYLGANTTVSGTLTLTSGLFNLGAYNLTLGTAAVAGSFSVTTMIVADGTGVVRRPYTAVGSYFFPIGEKTSNTTYSPITVNITAGTFSNAYVAVNVTDAVHPNNNSIGNYLTRYWTVTQTGITNAVATVTGNYVTGDAVGGESGLSAAQLNGTFNLTTNPWTKFAGLSGNTLTAAGAVLTQGQASYFTGIKTDNIAVVITGEGAFCQNETITLTAEVTGGDGPFTYEWSNGLGTNNTATPTTATPGSYNYSVTVRDANGIAATDAASLTVTETPVGGTATGNQQVCSGTQAAAITLTGYVGTIVRWERATNASFTNPTYVNVTTPGLTGTQMGTITATRYFRAVIQNGSCPLVYSNVITISVATTTWDGNTWSNGAPTLSTTVIFNSNYTATANIEACAIQVTNNAEVTIPSGFNVTINGALTVGSGNFIIEDNASLVQLTNVANTGNITVRKNSSLLYRQDYTLWSSPVAGQELKAFSPITLENRFYTFNPTANSYSPVAPVGTYFETGKSYLIRMPNELSIPGYNNGTVPVNFMGEFIGVPNNGTYNVSTIPYAAGSVVGFNIIGNPYPSPINVYDFYAANTANFGPNSALYFWRKRNDTNATSYASLTMDAYTANAAAGGGAEWEDLFNNDTEPDEWVINPGQGFFIQAGSTKVVFNNAMRRGDVHNGQFFKPAAKQDAAERSRFWLNFTDSSGGFSQMAVVYTVDATLDLDFGREAVAQAGSTASLYSVAQQTNLTIQARPEFINSDIVALGYEAVNAGTYTITLFRKDGVFENGQAIYLKDNLLGQIHDFADGNYEFSTEAGAFTGRFEVVYTDTTMGLDNPVVDANSVVVFKNVGIVNVNSGMATIKTVTVFDTRGRLLYTLNNINSTKAILTGMQVQEQMLIVNIETDKGTVSKKMVF